MVLPATHSAKSLACTRSLGARGIRTIVAAAESDVPAAWSRYCDEVAAVPSPHDDLIGYRDALLSLSARPDVRTIVPNREEDAFVLSRYRDSFADAIEVLEPPFDALAIAHDGKRLAELAAAVDVPVPETRSFDAVADWDRELIVKPRYSILTSDYVDFLAPEECIWRLDPIHPAPGEAPDREHVLETMLGHVPIVQEYVPIEAEYSVRALYDHGEAVATSVRRQDRGMTYAGGASVYRELVENPHLERLARRLLDALEWHGLATVQFIERADGDGYVLCEINPRTWTSIPCDVRAGADYPYFCWLLATDRADEIDPSHEVGVATHLLYGEFQYLLSVLRDEYPNAERPTVATAAREILSSIVAQPHFDYLRPDDPLPFVRGLLSTVGQSE